jgi:hypothetical protein
MPDTPIPDILPNNTLMLPSIPETRNTSQLWVHRLKMQVRIAHQHLAQEVYTMPCMPVSTVVFQLRHGHIVAIVYCVEKNVICVSYSILR